MTCGCRCHALGDIPARLELPIYRGDTLALAVEMLDAGTGEPMDITGRSYAASIRASIDSVSSVDFDVAVDLTTSIVTLSLTASQTENDVPRRGIWDLQELVADTGDVTTLLRGPVVASHDITT